MKPRIAHQPQDQEAAHGDADPFSAWLDSPESQAWLDDAEERAGSWWNDDGFNPEGCGHA